MTILFSGGPDTEAEARKSFRVSVFAPDEIKSVSKAKVERKGHIEDHMRTCYPYPTKSNMNTTD